MAQGTAAPSPRGTEDDPLTQQGTADKDFRSLLSDILEVLKEIRDDQKEMM